MVTKWYCMQIKEWRLDNKISTFSLGSWANHFTCNMAIFWALGLFIILTSSNGYYINLMTALCGHNVSYFLANGKFQWADGLNFKLCGVVKAMSSWHQGGRPDVWLSGRLTFSRLQGATEIRLHLSALTAYEQSLFPLWPIYQSSLGIFSLAQLRILGKLNVRVFRIHLH